MKHFALHTTYTLTTEKGAITPEGKRLIQSFISSFDIVQNSEWSVLNPNNTRRFLTPLPDVDMWAWFWLVQRGEYRGTFAKRVAQYYKKQLDLTCPKSFIEKIGNLARSHSLEAYTYQFDFTDRFNWYSGDYGDSGSCYWGTNSDAREALEEEGCLAIRFSDENGGYARAWLYPTEDFYIVFNGYGLTTLEIAKIFATWLGMDYQRIDLYNNGQTSGLIYLNGSGKGYAVGENIGHVQSYDLDIYTPNACESCGRDMGEDSYTTPNDEEYCADCFYERYDHCQECDRVNHRDHLTYVESTEHDVCDTCLRSNYTLCDYCDNYYIDSEVEEDKRGLAKCEGCRERD